MEALGCRVSGLPLLQVKQAGLGTRVSGFSFGYVQLLSQ